MTETYAVYLQPRGALASPLGSDTLFGAVCWALRLLGLADVGAMLSSFVPPRFAFSSAFPCYVAGQERIRFYPRPLSLEPTAAQVEQVAGELAHRDPNRRREALPGAVARAKDLREVEFISESIFQEIATGQAESRAILKRLRQRASAPQDLERDGPYLFSGAEQARVRRHAGSLRGMTTRRAVQHNQCDRLAGATVDGMLFYIDEIAFAPGAGLWCLLRASPDDLHALLLPALRLIEDTGLGRDRQAGKGQFQITVDPTPFSLPRVNQANGWLCLSRYLPHQDELPKLASAGAPLAYRLVTLWPKRERRFPPQGEQTGTALFKRRLRVFEPGSVFPADLAPQGRLVAVAPAEEEGFTVYQSGLAVGAPLLVREA